MAKKIKNPELLVAEIHTQQSKLSSLKAQYQANDAKVERLQATNKAIKAKAANLQQVLQQNMIRAQQNGLKF